MVPRTIVMPRDGSFALALLGSPSRVHEPILNSFASKRIVAIFPCSLIVPIIAILPNLHFLVEDEYLTAAAPHFLWETKTIPYWMLCERDGRPIAPVGSDYARAGKASE